MLLDNLLRPIINGLFGRKTQPYEAIKSAFLWYILLCAVRKMSRIMKGDGVKEYVIGIVMPYIKRLPPVKRRLRAEQEDMRKSLEPKMLKDVVRPTVKLPLEGTVESKLMDLMHRRHATDQKYWKQGKISGSVYHGGDEHMDFIGRIQGMFAFTNPLHPDLHPSTRQMDAEVIRMCCNMYNGDTKTCGIFTTGGTESILLALKAYRDWGKAEYGISSPNVVICVTAHAAFDKAGQYFGIEIRHARAIPGTQRVDLTHAKSLMDSNTVAIVGSAPQFAHGSIDPIEDLSKLALAKGVNLHVDCCLGGFLLPFMEEAGFKTHQRFDFRVPGVTSISCDPHKYGFAPKGASVLMFSTPEMRHHAYCFVTKWTGGIYATASLIGSRPGGVVAATWAAMVKSGRRGYVETTRKIVQATKDIAKGIEGIDGVEVVGCPDACVVAFTGAAGSGINCYSIADVMQEKSGWNLATLQNPPSVHLALTLPSAGNAARFVRDLEEATAIVREDMRGEQKLARGGNAGIYGMAASVPAAFIEESVKIYLDTMVSTAVLPK